MFTNLVFNNGQQATRQMSNEGAFADVMHGVRGEIGMLQPYLVTVNGRNVPCVTIRTGRVLTNHDTGRSFYEKKEFALEDLARQGFYSPVANDTVLRKEEHIELQREVTTVARRSLRVWSDAAARVPYGGFNAEAKTVLQYEAMSDPGRAMQTMDLQDMPTNDMPLFELRSHPLPYTMSGFSVGRRKLMESRNMGTPLDMSMPEACTQRVAEFVEDRTLGIIDGLTYGTVSTGPTAITGTSTEYGYMDFPQRNTKSNFTAPTAGGWTPETTYNEFLAALETLRDDNCNGPFLVYHSRDWSQYLDRNFSVAGGNNNNETLRTMLRKIDGIEDVVRVDRLNTTFTFIFVQFDRKFVEAVNGMGITTFQWQDPSQQKYHFVIACIYVLRLKYDFTGQCGLLHGTTA